MSEANNSFATYVEKINRAPTVDAARSAFLAGTYALGFEKAALFSCGAFDAPPQLINFTRIPQAWLDHYRERKYYEIDPVFEMVQKKTRPFRWDDPCYRESLSAAQNAMLDECGEAGMAGGVAIPIASPGGWAACCALVTAHEGVDPVSHGLAHSLAVFAHARARRLLGDVRRGPRLSERERECLLLAARGKSDWAISEVFGLSERTVHHAIERAKKRYGVATRVQAIVHAIANGEFKAEDTML